GQIYPAYDEVKLHRLEIKSLRNPILDRVFQKIIVTNQNRLFELRRKPADQIEQGIRTRPDLDAHRVNRRQLDRLRQAIDDERLFAQDIEVIIEEDTEKCGIRLGLLLRA